MNTFTIPNLMSDTLFEPILNAMTGKAPTMRVNGTAKSLQAFDRPDLWRGGCEQQQMLVHLECQEMIYGPEDACCKIGGKFQRKQCIGLGSKHTSFVWRGTWSNEE